MKIHTFIYNENNNLNVIPKNNFNYIIWNYDLALKLLELKYIEWIVYFKRLILTKSRENFIKYIIIKEFGGMFINIELLKLLTESNINMIEELVNSDNDMIFWLNEHQSKFTLEIFDINEYLLNDDIFYIKNNSNSFINYLLEKINKSIIPTNEYQNKIYLGNIFLSIELEKFYRMNFNLCVLESNSNNDNWLNKLFSYGNLKLHYNQLDKQKNKYEKSIYFIKLEKKFYFNLDYKLKIYPDISELAEPENKINSWNLFLTIKKYLEDIILILVVQNYNLIILFVFICLITILNYFIKIYLQCTLDIKIPKGQIDSITLFYPQKYKFLKELQKNWKQIQLEAINVMTNAPKLDISRTINDWYDSKTYVNGIKNKYGWIRSWSYDPKGTVLNQSTEGNYEWLNYGLIYFGDEFSENIKFCPKTFELLNKIKPHINICGFSWMLGGCLLQPHSDITGIESGSLAMHLGLDIPKLENSCRLNIKNSNGEYTYVNEENGKMFIFDATFEHYAYNLSNSNRLILYMDFKTI